MQVEADAHRRTGTGNQYYYRSTAHAPACIRVPCLLCLCLCPAVCTVITCHVQTTDGPCVADSRTHIRTHVSKKMCLADLSWYCSPDKFAAFQLKLLLAQNASTLQSVPGLGVILVSCNLPMLPGKL